MHAGGRLPSSVWRPLPLWPIVFAPSPTHPRPLAFALCAGLINRLSRDHRNAGNGILIIKPPVINAPCRPVLPLFSCHSLPALPKPRACRHRRCNSPWPVPLADDAGSADRHGALTTHLEAVRVCQAPGLRPQASGLAWRSSTGLREALPLWLAANYCLPLPSHLRGPPIHHSMPCRCRRSYRNIASLLNSPRPPHFLTSSHARRRQQLLIDCHNALSLHPPSLYQLRSAAPGHSPKRARTLNHLGSARLHPSQYRAVSCSDLCIPLPSPPAVVPPLFWPPS